MGLEYLPPTSDSVFKALFGNQHKKEFILSFLSSFLEIPNDELFNVKFLDPLFPIVVFILNYKMKPEKFNNSFAYFNDCLSN